MAYKRLIKKIQSIKAYYLQEIETVDIIFLKDIIFLFSCVLMLGLSAMFIILLMEVFIWMK